MKTDYVLLSIPEFPSCFVFKKAKREKMAAFSYQQQFQPFMLDPLLSPNTPYNSSFTTLNSLFSPSDQVLIHQSCSNNPDDVPNVMNCLDQDSRNGYNGVTVENMTYVTGKQSITESSSAVVDDKFEEAELVNQRPNPMTRKRKSRNGSCSSSAQSKDARKVRSRKQKNCNKEEIKDKKKEEKSSKKGTEEQPKDYVHVRARRGQATDSHSLAERVRRERISERMKILQQLVPGCDKVTGKALMLDEIINYVQSLHNQVEFLSMKLASLSSLIYECGVDLDGFMVRPEGLARFEPAEMPRVQQMGPLLATSAFTDVMANNPYPATLLHDPSLLLLPQSNNPLQVPAQIHGNEMREVEGEKRQKYVHPTGFTNNWCSFH